MASDQVFEQIDPDREATGDLPNRIAIAIPRDSEQAKSLMWRHMCARSRKRVNNPG
jgi:hypothetical protein